MTQFIVICICLGTIIGLFLVMLRRAGQPKK